MELILRYLLGPVLLYQGRKARKQVIKLQAPPYERTGYVGHAPKIRLLLIGDSSAEGVGADNFNHTLMGHLIKSLAELEVSFEWRVIARSGYTTANVLRTLKQIEPSSYDIAITALGINDITSSISLDAWLQNKKDLYEHLSQVWGVEHIIVSGLPPIGSFPALPNPLRLYLANRALRFEKQLVKIINKRELLRFLPLDFCADISHMAKDGFHPGPVIYKIWAKAILELLPLDLF